MLKGLRFVDCSIILAEDDELNIDLVDVTTLSDTAKGELRYIIRREEGD